MLKYANYFCIYVTNVLFLWLIPLLLYMIKITTLCEGKIFNLNIKINEINKRRKANSIRERKFGASFSLSLLLFAAVRRDWVFWYYDLERALCNVTANAKLFHAHRQKSLPTTCETSSSPSPPPPWRVLAMLGAVTREAFGERVETRGVPWFFSAFFFQTIM